MVTKPTYEELETRIQYLEQTESGHIPSEAKQHENTCMLGHHCLKTSCTHPQLLKNYTRIDNDKKFKNSHSR